MFNKIKRAFGFSDPEDDELISDDPDIISSSSETELTVRESENLPDRIEDLDLTSQKIFEHVVDEFNKALPSFLRDSVDPDKQQKFLFDTLNSDIKAHFQNLEKQMMSRLEEKWHSERERLQTDLKQLEQTAKDIESKRASIKEKQLSAERQRRALSDRVRDLEKQIMTLEAEKEQYELETKSLVNKVKVSQVYEKDIEAMREQVAYLQSEVDKYKNASSGESQATVSQIDQETQKELERLAKIETDYNTLIATLDEFEKKMDDVQRETETKNAEIKNLKKRLEEVQATNEHGVSSEEVQRLQNKLASTEAELEMAMKAVTAAEARAQKAEASLKMTKEKSPKAPGSTNPGFDDDILNGTEWAITSPVRRPRKTSQTKKDRGDEGELSLW